MIVVVCVYTLGCSLSTCSVAVYNRDINNAKNPSTNVVGPQTYTFEYQPLIPQTTLVVNVSTIAGVDTLRAVRAVSTNNFTIPGDSTYIFVYLKVYVCTGVVWYAS